MLLKAFAVLNLFIVLSSAISPLCSEIFPGCEKCASDFSTCESCEPGFFLLAINTQSNGTPVSTCVTDCGSFNTHSTSLTTRSCSRNCQNASCQICGSDGVCLDPSVISSIACPFESFEMPDGSCADYACPPGYYRDASTKKCQACSNSCWECQGSQPSSCLSCPSGYFLKLSVSSSKQGTCEAQTTQSPVPSLELFVSNDLTILTDGNGDPLPAANRDGSMAAPFLDIRDALIRANQWASSYSDASVTIYFTKGSHFVPLEQESVRYTPVGTQIDPTNLAYSLTIKQELLNLRPLPCTLTPSPGSLLDIAQTCVLDGETVELRVKIGAYFTLKMPRQSIVERLVLDFTDSLLPWNSSCQSLRALSCSATYNSATDSIEVTNMSPDPDCACQMPSRQVSSCNYNHPVTLFDAYPSQMPIDSSNNEKTLTLSSVTVRYEYSFYNSLVGFSSNWPIALQLDISDSTFEHISMCGSIIGSQSLLPYDSTNSISSIQKTIVNNHPSYQQTAQINSSLTISSTNFKHIGLQLHFYNSMGPLIYRTQWANSNFTRLAPVLSLSSFPGEIVITYSFFQSIKLDYNYTHYANRSYSEIVSGSSSLVKRHFGMIQHYSIQIDSASKGITIFNSHFSNCSTVSGLVNIGTASVFTKGALLAYNSFSNSAILSSSGVVNLQAAYDQNSDQSCTGFHIEGNKFKQLVTMGADSALLKLSCAIPVTQLDEMEGNSITELEAALALSPSLIPSLSEPPSLQFTYGLTPELDIQADYSRVKVINNSFFDNYHRPKEGSVLVIDYIPYLDLVELRMDRNGDLCFIDTSQNISYLWSQRGIHASSIGPGLLTQTSWQATFTASLRRDALISIYGVTSVSIVDSIFTQNWFVEESDSSEGLFLVVKDSSSLQFQNVTVNTILSDLEPLFQIYTQLPKLDSTSPSHQFESTLRQLQTSSPLMLVPATLKITESSFSFIESSTAFIQVQSAGQVQITDSKFVEMKVSPLVRSDSISLSSISVNNTQFLNYPLIGSFGATSTFTMDNCTINNEEQYLFDSHPSQCALLESASSCYIANTLFHNANSGLACRSSLITNPSDVQLTLINSKFRNYEMQWGCWTHWEYQNTDLIKLTGASKAVISNLVISDYVLNSEGSIIKLEGPLTELELNSAVITRVAHNIISVIEGKARLEYFTYEDNTIECGWADAIQVSSSDHRFSIRHSTFTGSVYVNELINVEHLAKSKTLDQGEIEPNSSHFLNLYNCTFIDNDVYKILTVTRSVFTIKEATFLRNIDGFLQLHSTIDFSDSEIVFEWSSFSQSGSDLDSSCPVPAYGGVLSSLVQSINCYNLIYTSLTFEDICLSFEAAISISACKSCSVDQSTFSRLNSLDSISAVINVQGIYPYQVSLSFLTMTDIVPTVFYLNNANTVALQCLFDNIQNGFNIIGGTYSENKMLIRNIDAPLKALYLLTLTNQAHCDFQVSNVQNAVVSRIMLVTNEFSDSAQIVISKNKYHNITVKHEDGGAFMFRRNQMNIVFEQNQIENVIMEGQRAVGLLHWGVQESEGAQFTRNSYINVHAAIGCLIYYEYSIPSFDISLDSINYSSSLYGSPIASYPVRMAFITQQEYQNYLNGERSPITSPIMQITRDNFRSGGTLQQMYIALLDIRNYIYTLQNQGSLTFTFLDIQADSEYTPVLLNSPSKWVNGAITEGNVTVIAEPGRSISIELVSTNLIDSTKPDTIQSLADNGRINPIIKLNVRYCEAGQALLRTGECQSCKANTYLFGNVTSTNDCLVCPQFARCFGGEQIGPMPGFWRSNRYSLTFFSCINPAACLGSFHPDIDDRSLVQYNPNGDCAENYEGKLCSQCASGYTRNSRFECSKCPNPWLNLFFTLVILIVVIMLISLLIYLTIKSMSSPKSIFSVYFRIVLNHLQLLMLVAGFRFDWPPPVKAFFAIFQSVSDAPQSLFSFECLFDVISSLPRFYINLILYCSLPVIGTVCLTVFWKIKYRTDKSVFQKRCTASILIFVFLVHPAVTNIIFSLFNCFNVDGTNYLYEELSEECWSTNSLHFIFIIVLGVPAMLIWVLGVPLWTWMVLIQKKNQLQNQEVREKYGFLYNGFKQRSYFWEAVSILRKEAIAMISVFLVQQGTLVQSYLLLLVLVLFILLTLQLQPYDRPKLNRLEMYSFFAITITVFAGIFFLGARDMTEEAFEHGKDYALEGRHKWVLFFVILLTNLIFFVRTGWSILSDLRHTLRKNYPKFYASCCLCFNRNLLQDQEQQFKANKDNLGKVRIINQIIGRLSDFRAMYEKNQDFADKPALNELLYHIMQRLNKVQNFKNVSVVSTNYSMRKFRQQSTSNNESIDYMNFKKNSTLNQEDANYDIEFQEFKSNQHLKREQQLQRPKEVKYHQRLRGETQFNHDARIAPTEDFRPQSLMDYLNNDEEQEGPPECTVQYKQSGSPLNGYKVAGNFEEQVEGNNRLRKTSRERIDRLYKEEDNDEELLKAMFSREIEVVQEGKEIQKEDDESSCPSGLLQDIKLTSSKGAQQYYHPKRKNGKIKAGAVAPEMPTKRNATMKKIQVVPVRSPPERAAQSNKI